MFQSLREVKSTCILQKLRCKICTSYTSPTDLQILYFQLQIMAVCSFSKIPAIHFICCWIVDLKTNLVNQNIIESRNHLKIVTLIQNAVMALNTEANHKSAVFARHNRKTVWLISDHRHAKRNYFRHFTCTMASLAWVTTEILIRSARTRWWRVLFNKSSKALLISLMEWIVVKVFCCSLRWTHNFLFVSFNAVCKKKR